MISLYYQLLKMNFIQVVAISYLVIILVSPDSAEVEFLIEQVDNDLDENFCATDDDCSPDLDDTEPLVRWAQQSRNPNWRQESKNVELNFPFGGPLRIVNGNAPREFQFPYLVLLMLRMFLNSPWCGGTILSDKFILTAAHCFFDRATRRGPLLWLYPPSFFYAVAGTNDPTAFYGWPPHAQIRFAKTVYVHPHFDIPPRSTFNDFAIFEAQEPFVLDGKHVDAKQLPHFNGQRWLTKQTHRNDVICTLVGWGSVGPYLLVPPEPRPIQNIGLKTINVQLLPFEKCFKAYGRRRVDEELHLCAGSYMKDTCQGDSGGPLSCYFEEGKLTLVGVVSFGRGCANPNFYGVYARLDNAETWIRAITRIDDVSAGNLDKRFVIQPVMMNVFLIHIVHHCMQ